MKLRYEIRDTHHPEWKGQRFSSLVRAEREFSIAHGEPGRWQLFDRLTKVVLATS